MLVDNLLAIVVTIQVINLHTTLEPVSSTDSKMSTSKMTPGFKAGPIYSGVLDMYLCSIIGRSNSGIARAEGKRHQLGPIDRFRYSFQSILGTR